jgi:hypothetical protein
MAGPNPKFSDAQRNAIVRRVLVDQVPVTDAVGDAAAGGLADVEAFEVPTSTAQRWVREARNEEPDAQPTAQPDAGALDGMRTRLWALHLKSVDELERRYAEATGDEMEQRALHRLMLAAIKRQRELEKLAALAPMTPAVSPGANGASEPDPTPESSFLEGLAREHAETEKQTPAESESASAAERNSSRQNEAIGEDR